jgi:hypothetical protein
VKGDLKDSRILTREELKKSFLPPMAFGLLILFNLEIISF